MTDTCQRTWYKISVIKRTIWTPQRKDLMGRKSVSWVLLMARPSWTIYHRKSFHPKHNMRDREWLVHCVCTSLPFIVVVIRRLSLRMIENIETAIRRCLSSDESDCPVRDNGEAWRGVVSYDFWEVGGQHRREHGDIAQRNSWLYEPWCELHQQWRRAPHLVRV